MDSSESMPLSAFDCTGTPSTGTRVLDAVIPGRCAAPPAPAMIAAKPRLSAFAVVEQQVRCAMGGNHLHFMRYAELFQQLGGRLQVSQSDCEPMMMPTSGFIDAV